MTPWPTLSIEQVLDRLQDLVDVLPEAQRLDVQAGIQVLADHIHEINTELVDLEDEG